MKNAKTCAHIFIMIGLLATGLHVNAATDRDTMFRKGLGLLGGVVAISGLWKIGHAKPLSGLARIIGGAVISVGGICSDIILTKLNSLTRRVDREKQRRQPREQGFFSWLKSGVRDFAQDAQDVLEGSVYAAGNKAATQNFDIGWDNFKNGNVLTGIDQMYDGVYHHVRLQARAKLYPEHFAADIS